MKQLLLTAIFAFFLQACQNKEATKNTTTTETKTAASAAADSIGITEALHGFFTWYDANNIRISKIDLTKQNGKYLELDEKQLQNYLGEIKKSGFVSDELIADETKFYQACAKLWANESNDEINSGMESDRFLCAQDYIAPYNTGSVKSIITGDRAHSTLTLKADMNQSNDFNFEMKKENGKWLLAKLDCDSGVKY